jgi:cytochrome c oxidase subunit 2
MSAAGANQSALSAAGIHASSIENLWWLMFWVAVFVMAIVSAFVVAAVVRGLRNGGGSATVPTSERTLTRAVSLAVGATVVILLGLLVASIWTGRLVGSVQASSAVTIEIVGHQWWWEVHYDDAVPSRRVVTANEFHIPVNRPVVLKVTSRDVIHSFWVPNLQGKRDLIPGYTTALWIQADRPGVFRGQCAEFCGLQHAHMAMAVVAETDAQFNAWLDAMRQPAAPPHDAAAEHGRDVFMRSRCAGCHAIKGTDAAGQIAPDLTHVATRGTLGAGTLPNTADHLLRWIQDPQRAKPGNQMPPNPLSPDEVQALTAYLGTLR